MGPDSMSQVGIVKFPHSVELYGQWTSGVASQRECALADTSLQLVTGGGINQTGNTVDFGSLCSPSSASMANSAFSYVPGAQVENLATTAILETDNNISGGQRASQGAIPSGIVCGNCAGKRGREGRLEVTYSGRGHTVKDCTRSVDNNGFINACPFCNKGDHNPNTCKSGHTRSNAYYLLVQCRHGKPPIRCNWDLRALDPAKWDVEKFRPQNPRFAKSQKEKYGDQALFTVSMAPLWTNGGKWIYKGFYGSILDNKATKQWRGPPGDENSHTASKQQPQPAKEPSNQDTNPPASTKKLGARIPGSLAEASAQVKNAGENQLQTSLGRQPSLPASNWGQGLTRKARKRSLRREQGDSTVVINQTSSQQVDEPSLGNSAILITAYPTQQRLSVESNQTSNQQAEHSRLTNLKFLEYPQMDETPSINNKLASPSISSGVALIQARSSVGNSRTSTQQIDYRPPTAEKPANGIRQILLNPQPSSISNISTQASRKEQGNGKSALNTQDAEQQQIRSPKSNDRNSQGKQGASSDYSLPTLHSPSPNLRERMELEQEVEELEKMIKLREKRNELRRRLRALDEEEAKVLSISDPTPIPISERGKRLRDLEYQEFQELSRFTVQAVGERDNIRALNIGHETPPKRESVLSPTAGLARVKGQVGVENIRELGIVPACSLPLVKPIPFVKPTDGLLQRVGRESGYRAPLAPINLLNTMSRRDIHDGRSRDDSRGLGNSSDCSFKPLARPLPQDRLEKWNGYHDRRKDSFEPRLEPQRDRSRSPRQYKDQPRSPPPHRDRSYSPRPYRERSWSRSRDNQRDYRSPPPRVPSGREVVTARAASRYDPNSLAEKYKLDSIKNREAQARAYKAAQSEPRERHGDSWKRPEGSQHPGSSRASPVKKSLVARDSAVKGADGEVRNVIALKGVAARVEDRVVAGPGAGLHIRGSAAAVTQPVGSREGQGGGCGSSVTMELASSGQRIQDPVIKQEPGPGLLLIS